LGNDLRIESQGRIALVTLNRPAARNALSVALLAELREVMAALDGDGDVSAVILTGADPAFCAGLDLKELSSGRKNLAATAAGRGAAIVEYPFARLAKPVIGAINGPAVTGGLEVALHCTFLVASERAVFADTHAKVGLQPGWGLTVGLTEAIGLRRAREMSVTGKIIDARTALAWGLVNHVVGHAELVPYCLRLAGDVAEINDRAVARVLQTYAEQEDLAGLPARYVEADAQWRWLRGAPPVDRAV
jgi:enoyl-CoA hydratase